MPPDIVYVVRPGDRNEELRYSLRSLTNLPHRHVWIAGHMPPWINAGLVGHIPTTQTGSKADNSRSNLVAALNTAAVSDPFVLMCDDFYIMRPLEQLPVVNAGPLAAVIADSAEGTYRRGLTETLEKLRAEGIADPVAYDGLHCPQQFNKAGLAEILAAGWRKYATAYGNLIRTDPGTTMPNAKNPPPETYGGMTFLSSNDRSFGKAEPMGRHIRATFPQPCRYER